MLSLHWCAVPLLFLGRARRAVVWLCLSLRFGEVILE